MEITIDSYSLMRSGHHAVLFWLAENFKNPATVELYSDNKGISSRVVKQGTGPRIKVFENLHLRDRLGPSIIVFRDPYNNYASYLKMIQDEHFGVFHSFPFIEYWKEYAREIVGKTDFLKDKIFISFNLWNSREDYRRYIVKLISESWNLPMEFNDSLFEVMPNYGGGSSFDKMTHKNSASKMKLNERYKEFLSKSSFCATLKDPEIADLSEKLFQFNPLKEEKLEFNVIDSESVAMFAEALSTLDFSDIS